MATPTGIITGSGGPTAHNNCIATGTFVQDGTPVDPLWIHLAFVPKLVFVGNATDGELYVWWEHCPSRYCKLVDTSTLQAVGNGVTPIDGSGAASLVTAADTFLKEGVAYTSDGLDPEDRIIGIKLEGLCGCEASKAFYYCAMR